MGIHTNDRSEKAKKVNRELMHKVSRAQELKHKGSKDYANVKREIESEYGVQIEEKSKGAKWHHKDSINLR